jgi:hypothetical protein
MHGIAIKLSVNIHRLKSSFMILHAATEWQNDTRRLIYSHEVRRCPVCFLPLDASNEPISEAFKKHVLETQRTKREGDRVKKTAEGLKQIEAVEYVG